MTLPAGLSTFRDSLTLPAMVNMLGYVETGSCVLALCAITFKRQWKDYGALGLILAVRLFSDLILVTLLSLAHNPLYRHPAYVAYFYLYWIGFAVEALLMLAVIYTVFRLAMAPLKGLQTLGMLVFRWAAAISIAVALGSSIGSQQGNSTYLQRAVLQLQRTESILTLCLLLFVWFAIRPMGLSYRSRIFGVSLGLGIMAANDLVQSAWLSLKPHMNTVFDFANDAVICTGLLIWTAYFLMPEPRRRIIVLPTTSPFLRWNQISLALGDDPGYVAVGGVPPELFAPAELEVMQRASLKMVTPVPKSGAPVAKSIGA